MDRWAWMAIWMYAPAFGLLTASPPTAFAIEDMRQSALPAGAHQTTQWLPLLGFGVGVLWALITRYRSWRQYRGKSTDTCECNELLH